MEEDECLGPWGLYDCSGDVYEWCNDQWDSDAYKNRSGTVEDPSVYGSAVASRSSRGGDWYDGADSCRVAHRISYGLGDCRRRYLGFLLSHGLSGFRNTQSLVVGARSDYRG